MVSLPLLVGTACAKDFMYVLEGCVFQEPFRNYTVYPKRKNVIIILTNTVSTQPFKILTFLTALTVSTVHSPRLPVAFCSSPIVPIYRCPRLVSLRFVLGLCLWETFLGPDGTDRSAVDDVTPPAGRMTSPTWTMTSVCDVGEPARSDEPGGR